MLYVVKKNGLYFTEVKVKPAERYERSEPKRTLIFGKNYRKANFFTDFNEAKKVAKHCRGYVSEFRARKEYIMWEFKSNNKNVKCEELEKWR